MSAGYLYAKKVSADDRNQCIAAAGQQIERWVNNGIEILFNQILFRVNNSNLIPVSVLQQTWVI